MNYPFSENKGADQLRGYREADLRLCFRIYIKPVFSRRGSDGFSGHFFRFLFVAIYDLVHDVEAMFHLPSLLTAPGNLFWNISDASFTGITHISEKDFSDVLSS